MTHLFGSQKNTRKDLEVIDFNVFNRRLSFICSTTSVILLAVVIFVFTNQKAWADQNHNGQEQEELAVDSSRIVSIGGSVTELLYAFGVEENIVGVDTTSVFPTRALIDNPDVGYMRQLSAEGILSLDPTLILAIESAGPPEVVEVLRKASVKFVSVPNDPTAEGVLAKTRFVADVLGLEEQGETLAKSLEHDFSKLRSTVNELGEKRNLLFILSLRDGNVMASGANTAASGIIELAGARNAIDGFDGYKPISNEALITAAPETILMMRGGDGHEASADDVFSLPAMKATPAFESKAFLQIDGAYMLGFGPRTAQAARDLGKALYPEIDWPELGKVPVGVSQ